MTLLVALWGCGGGCAGPEPIEVEPPPTQTDLPEPTDTQDPLLPDCSAYDWRGVAYDCNTVDRCDDSSENLQPRLACCDCDPRLCLPDLNCQLSRNDDPLPPPPPVPPPEHSSCMVCHNGATQGDPVYSGEGISNPHAYGSAGYIDCTSCHGGDGTPGNTAEEAHIPAPPISDVQKRTLAGIEDLPTWPGPPGSGTVIEPLDWLQFRNPGDLRVAFAGRGCGTTGCHGDEQTTWLQTSPMATNSGIYAGAGFSFGAQVEIPSYRGVWNETAAALAITSTQAPDYGYVLVDPLLYGLVPSLDPHPDPAAIGGSLQATPPIASDLDDDVLDG